MLDLTHEQHEKIAAICRNRGVERLVLFGSATGPSFDLDRSDVDVLVQFRPDFYLGPWLAGFFDLKADLEAVFGRPVDLIEEGAIRSERLRQAIANRNTLLYAA